MNNGNVKERANLIRRGFRLLMNGETSRSMRGKGLHYHINWGVALTDLRQQAAEIGKDGALARELWKDDVRECKILATMLMPPAEMDGETAREWMAGATTQEVAEQLAFNLLQHHGQAVELARHFISGPEILSQIGGFSLLSCLLKKGLEISAESKNFFLQHASQALSSNHYGIRHAAQNALLWMEEGREQ